eukprot:TRINITY_DN4675_c0_g2_i3.p1 TRINITY_DN4675_c0_g2~~TRINITY_DN4675_c0_g2_i3.p1  ORF type:complete len:742 (+),score=218.81 TRINITY_DN4675_c0_g2_i3:321-2546(+)
MTGEVVQLFQDGHQQEALEAALGFTHSARKALGERHPVYINAMATVAALIDQLGAKDEAELLLAEAEVLHQELLQEQAQGRYVGDVPHVSSSDEAEDEDDDHESVSSGGDGDIEGDGMEDIENTRFERALRAAEAKVDGDDNSRPPESDAEDLEEAEAEAITRLTWEVNKLLREDHPQAAAELLSTAERVLLEDGTDIGGLSKAALHALWASILDAIGEEDTAKELYDQAMICLDEDGGAIATSASSTSDGDIGDEEDLEEESALDPSDEDHQLSDEAPSEAEVQPGRTGAAATGDTFCLTSEDATLAPSPPPLAEQTKEPEALPRPDSVADATSPLQQHAPQPEPAQEDCGDQPRETSATKAAPLPAGDVAAATHEEPAMEMSSPVPPVSPTIPSQPKPAGGSGRPRRPVAKATPAVTSSAPMTAQSKTTTAAYNANEGKRVGGGYVNPPSAPKPKAKGKGRPKAKAKAAVELPLATQEEKPTEDASDPAPAADKPAAEQAEAAAEPEALPEAPTEPPTEEAQKVVVGQAMTTADHLLGLMHFEKAADKLEEQLVELSKESSPLRHSDTHVDVLMKYGGILWWDGDAEGAVDAFVAGDEILASRQSSSVSLKMRQADIYSQVAQVYRGCGDLDSADEHLSKAVSVLEELADFQDLPGRDKGDETGTIDDALRDARAALAQICVQREDYSRAERLYLKAFTSGAAASDDEDADPATDDAHGPAAVRSSTGIQRSRVVATST